MNRKGAEALSSSMMRFQSVVQDLVCLPQLGSIHRAVDLTLERPTMEERSGDTKLLLFLMLPVYLEALSGG